MNLKTFWAVALFLFLSVGNAFGAPAWTTATPKADSNFKYYVGRGEGSSEKAAFDSAVKDAYDQAARENFPAEYSYQADIYQTEKSSYLTERTIVSGISARFDGFEKDDEFIQKNKNGDYTAKLLYRFSKQAIAAEKARLKQAAKSPKKQQMSVVGTKADAAKGVLIVETEPADGAAVYVDGDRFGQTPMTLYGSLSTGSHSLRIDHPRYETVTERIITAPGKTVRVKKTLVPAFATVSVTTDPVDADVYLDGRPIGTAPMTYTRMPVEEEVTISLRHPEMERMSVPVTLRKGDNRPINISLPEKPAKLSLFSFPQGAEVFVDKAHVGTTPLRDFTIARGSHTFTLEKDGFEPVTESFAVKGGEAVSKSVELQKTVQVQTVGKTAVSVVSGGVDKFHRYEEKLPAKKPLSLGRAKTGEDVLMAVMEWSYPSNFIRARTSYRKHNDGTIFFVFLSFDEDNYQKLFVKPAVNALKNVTENHTRQTKKVACQYDEKKEGQIQCDLYEDKKAADTIWIKASPIKHNYFSDKVDFEKFDLLMSNEGRRYRIKPYEKRRLTVTAYDRKGKAHVVMDEDLNVKLFDHASNRSVTFMPSMNNGFESLVLAAVDNNLPADGVSRVVVKIGEGTRIDNPYPPLKIERKM